MLNTRALTSATVVGTVLQVAMVVCGHVVPAVAALFAVGGMTISLVAGVLYGRAAGGTRGGAASGGLLAGAICAFLGILVSYLLGDVPATLLALGTASSAVTGLLGGFAATLFGRRAAAAA